MTIAERIKQGWVAIFRPGTHRAMDGKEYTFSDQDVAGIAESYSPAVHQSPAVIGHPELDAPAYAWAEGLEFADGVLWARLKDVAANFSAWVKQGWYRNISASFYQPEKSPVPGQWYLKHIGFLGAAPPAVPGLPHAAFAAGESVSFEEPMPILDELAVQDELGRLDGILRLFWDQVWSLRYGSDVPDRKAAIVAKVADLNAAIDSLDFSEEEPPMEKKTFLEWLRDGLREVGLLPATPPTQPAQFSEADVAAREKAAADKARKDAEAAGAKTARAQAVHAEVAAFVDAGVKAGTFLPAWRDAGIPQVIEQAMLSEAEVGFAEGKPARKAGEVLMELFKTMPKIVPLGEHAPGSGTDPDAGLKAEFAAGRGVHDQLGVTFEMFKKTRGAKN